MFLVVSVTGFSVSSSGHLESHHPGHGARTSHQPEPDYAESFRTCSAQREQLSALRLLREKQTIADHLELVLNSADRMATIDRMCF